MRVSLRRGLLRLMMRMERCYYFIFDVHYYWRIRRHPLRFAFRLALKTIY